PASTAAPAPSRTAAGPPPRVERRPRFAVLRRTGRTSAENLNRMGGPGPLPVAGYVAATSTKPRRRAAQEAGPMVKIAKYVGLDVHKDTIAITSCDGGPGNPAKDEGVIPHDLPKLRRKLLSLAPAEH